MRSKGFLYYINSQNAREGVDSANNCNIEFRGLPTNPRFFKCDVLNFMINPTSLDNTDSSLEFIALTVDNFIYDSYSTFTNGQADVVAEIYTSDCMTFKRNQFIVENINNKVLHFQLADITGNVIDDALINQIQNTIWTLALYLEPIEEN